MKKLGAAILGLMFITSAASAQQRVLDKVVAVVGNGIILQSNIESDYARYIYEAGANGLPPDMKCQLLQHQLTQKLLAQQAVIDSVTVKDEDVDFEVDRRMRIMKQRAGGQEKLEAFLKRSTIQYQDEIRPDIREMLTAQRMQQKITERVNVSPQDVKHFYDAIAKDSLPVYSKEVEVGEIVFTPALSKEEKQEYKDKLEAIRQRVKNGEDFGKLARVYSQDAASAVDGGDVGFFDRAQMVKEFTAAAFKMKAGELSQVIETDFGFHLIQVIERRGEQVHARHILIMPSITESSLDRSKSKADSVFKQLIGNKKIDFSNAAAFYSDSKETKFNGGMMLNAQNVNARTTYIPTELLDPQVALVVDTMKVGQISKPVLITSQDGHKSYKLLYLKSVTDAHKANLDQDFPKLKELAFENKINRTVSQWFEKKRKDTYIRIDAEFQTCNSLKDWVTTTTAQAKP
ncbi:peptidylprolyl isomerase [Mucilaginibacter myungsuensis]|uniref:Peptidylprolyl isomerase n=1 Tax=Mucilaginibacter myungsuensis TaxID=649104 RepID=A0A929PX02_9SPHI|nr:peptidylprolyl isomerase [Mucilaginibacter myungsuensis]MBE9661717.1 peptidylprolyl isomerase [Mucilaginibacter myungsuensis]MDN3597860.1 peptidylprolyl isomerase [Mucilaginibacter myungsuensis]